MTAIVFGATGLTGRHTVEALRAAGERVIAHVRPGSPRTTSARAQLGALGAEIEERPWEPTAIEACIAEHAPTLVFITLGTTQSRAKKEGLPSGSGAYDLVDVRLSEMVIDAVARHAPRARIVYLSSAGAGSGSGSYLRARERVEGKLAGSGVPFTIARPSFIVGDRDDPRASERIGAPIADAGLSLLGVLGMRKVAARYRSITGAALGSALVRLGRDPSWAGRIAEREDL